MWTLKFNTIIYFLAKYYLAFLSCLKMVILTIFLDAKNEMIKITSFPAPFYQFLGFCTPTIDKEPENLQIWEEIPIRFIEAECEKVVLWELNGKVKSFTFALPFFL